MSDRKAAVISIRAKPIRKDISVEQMLYSEQASAWEGMLPWLLAAAVPTGLAAAWLAPALNDHGSGSGNRFITGLVVAGVSVVFPLLAHPFMAAAVLVALVVKVWPRGKPRA